MFNNKLKRLLQDGEIPIGIVISHTDSDYLGMMLASAGYDFVLIDTEHTSFTTKTVARLSSQALANGLTPLARIPDDDLRFISRCFDSGVQGLMIPMAETAKQLERVVERIKYAPLGKRGLFLQNQSTGFCHVPYEQYIKTSNQESMFIIQIETQTGLDNLEEMAAVEGVDMFEIGPWDLSLSLGIPGEFNHPKFLKAVARMVEVSKKYHIWSSIYTASPEQAARYVGMGVNMLFYMSDVTLLVDKPKEEIKGIRQKLAQIRTNM